MEDPLPKSAIARLELWRHMHVEHGLTLFDAELDEILRLSFNVFHELLEEYKNKRMPEETS